MLCLDFTCNIAMQERSKLWVEDLAHEFPINQNERQPDDITRWVRSFIERGSIHSKLT